MEQFESEYLFSKVEELIVENHFSTAFRILESIAIDLETTNAIRSEAYNLMGVIVHFDPNLNPDEESGINFFSKSLELDSSNIGALFNVIETFGLSIDNHRNIMLLEFAINRLKSINAIISKEEMRMINEKLILKDRLCR